MHGDDYETITREGERRAHLEDAEEPPAVVHVVLALVVKQEPGGIRR